MHRILVSLLSALDSLVAAVVGVAVALAPLTVLWFVVFAVPDLGAIWNSSAVIWQLGHAVPVQITLPDLYLAQTGIDESLAGFALSIPPLGFAAFTFLFAARSGARAARAGAWITGVVTGALVFAALATFVAVTAGADIARVEMWQAILFPSAFYAAGVLGGAVRVAWSDGDDGPIDALRLRLDTRPGAWPEFPSLVARGAAIVLAVLSGVAALALALVLVVRGPQIVALSQSANLDGLGAVVMGIGQLLYLPTLIIWALAFVAGPGVALGAGAVVAPGGTQLGILPGIPVLGALPEATSPWLLTLALLPVAAGAFAGWAVRSRLSPRGTDADAESSGLLAALTAAIALVSALVVALLAVLASGSLGPGRLAAVGPDAAVLALAVGIEVGVGAGILLLAPRRPETDDRAPVGEWRTATSAPPDRPASDAAVDTPAFSDRRGAADDGETAPIPDAGGPGWGAPTAGDVIEPDDDRPRG